MKKWIILGLVILGLIAVFCGNRLAGGRLIFPAQVQRVEFRGYDSCDGPVSEKIQLTDDEVRTLLTYFTLASYSGKVTADSCCSDFGFTIYLEDGTTVCAREANSPRVRVSSRSGGRDYWVKSQALADYAQELIEKYNLQTNE